MWLKILWLYVAIFAMSIVAEQAYAGQKDIYFAKECFKEIKKTDFHEKYSIKSSFNYWNIKTYGEIVRHMDQKHDNVMAALLDPHNPVFTKNVEGYHLISKIKITKIMPWGEEKTQIRFCAYTRDAWLVEAR